MATITEQATSSSVKRSTSPVQPPINLEQWIEQNREKFKPPVSNRYLYDGRDFFVMVIKGPNARNDFHLVDSEEYFYQLKGDIKVRIREGDRIVTISCVKGRRSLFRPMFRTRRSVRRTLWGW
jgi:3-hydroxyanthranilate 3,4-dioxygenase